MQTNAITTGQIWYGMSLLRHQMTVMMSRIAGQSSECLFNSLLRLAAKKYQRPTLLSLCDGKPPVTSEFPTQKDSNTEMIPFNGLII